MLRLTVETNNFFNANVIASFLRNVKTVNKVVIEKPSSRKTLFKKTVPYNWTKPSRPATDEEIDKMLDECEKDIENGLGLPADVAKKQTMKEIRKWRKKKL